MLPRPAVVLLSGGLDSATTAAIAVADGWSVHALSVRYGQRHAAELEAARRVASALRITRHVIVDADLRAIGGSALTADIAVPKDRADAEIGTGIPVTYVPARNTILLSLALGLAETVGAFDLFIGANVLDYSGYPDCRPEYLAAFERLANLATAATVEGRGTLRIHAPLLQLTKAAIIRRAQALGLDLGLTLSCYDPDAAGHPCGRCDACHLRAKGFAEAGLHDPALAR